MPLSRPRRRLLSEITVPPRVAPQVGDDVDGGWLSFNDLAAWMCVTWRTIERWTEGLSIGKDAAGNDRRLRLDYHWRGGTRVSSKEAVRSFLEKLNAAKGHLVDLDLEDL